MKQASEEVLIGIIIDVSGSMKYNWDNRSRKKLPKIEVIRDALNEQFKKLTAIYISDHKNSHSVDIFCLAMGMVLPQSLEEDDEAKRFDVVCDILALAELLPNKDELDYLKDELNGMWSRYTEEILEKVQFDEDIQDQLHNYLAINLLESAKKKSENSWRYRIQRWLSKSKNTIFAGFLEKIEEFVLYWNNRIEEVSTKESARYIESITTKSEQIFLENKEKYSLYIEERLVGFADIQIRNILHLLGLGYRIDQLIEYFDKEKAFALAKDIFNYLDHEVQQSMVINWNQNKIILSLSSTSIRASIDMKYIKELTENYIKKIGWDTLREFIESKVNDLFIDTFNKQIKSKLPNWIEIATHREVTRSIKDIGNILPHSSEGGVYSEEFMFGATPIDMAIDRATLRFLDIYYQGKDKILFIITDGEFDAHYPTVMSDMLKKIGVVIIGCYVSNSNIIRKLTLRSSKRWPEGAKILFNMTSSIDEIPLFMKDLLQIDVNTPDKRKLFYQINQSEDLQKIIQAIIPEREKS